MTVTVTPQTFQFVHFDAALIQRIAESLTAALGLDRPVAIEVELRNVIRVFEPDDPLGVGPCLVKNFVGASLGNHGVRDGVEHQEYATAS